MRILKHLILFTLIASSISVKAEPLNKHSYWLGNSYPGGIGGKHVQMIVNDLATYGDRLFGISTWDEGGAFMSVYSTKDGSILGSANMKQVNSNWAEGAYGIAVDANYVYAAGQSKLYDYDTKQDTYRNVIFRFNHDASNANFEGGIEKGNTLSLSERFDFFVPPYGHDDMKKLSGVAVYEGELFVGDPLTEQIFVIDTASMKVIRARSIPFKNPGWLTVDKKGFLWVVDRDSQIVKKYERGSGLEVGTFTGVEITDVEEPAGIALDNDGNLLVCDNGLHQQQVRTYDTDGTFLRSFGQPAYGTAGGNTFFGITAVAMDDTGHVFTASHGVPGGLYRDFMHDRVGRGAEIAKFSPNGEREWDLHGLEWVTCGDIDPGEETEYFTADTWYSLDYSALTQPGIHHPTWAVKAYTIDPVKYPNDLRMHAFTHSARMERVQGKKLMLVKSEGSFRGIYRFEGQVAIPVALIASKGFNFTHRMTGEMFPPNGPKQPGIWMDKNGNGDFEADEFHTLTMPGGSMLMTPDGDMYLNDSKNLYKIPFVGFDTYGVPQWDLEGRVTTAAPESDIKDIIRVTYVPEKDIALVGCSTYDNPMDRIGKMIGNEVRRYDNWSAHFDGNPNTQPERIWSLTGEALPLNPSDGGHHGRLDKQMPTALHAVDDAYFFIGYDLHSEPVPEGEDPRRLCPDIRVYRMEDRSFVGLLEPQKEIGYGSGAAMDIAQ